MLASVQLSMQRSNAFLRWSEITQMRSPVRLRVTEQNAAELRVISEIDSKALDSAAKAVEAHKELMFRTSDLADIFKASGLSETHSESLARHLIGLARLANKKDMSTSAVIDALGRGMTATDRTRGFLAAWNDQKSTLQKILSLPQVALLAKSVELFYDHCASLRESRVLTDIRPIFDDSRIGVIGALIFSTLKLDYSTAEGPKSIEIVLKHEELRKLALQLETATRKTAALQQLVQERGLSHSVFAGEEVNVS